MTDDQTKADAGEKDVPGGYYLTDVPDHLVSSDGAYRLSLKVDGTVELRHNGSHEAWIVGP